MLTRQCLTYTMRPGGGGSPKWHWLSQVTGAFAADTARDMATVATFPLGPYADYAALQAAVADGSMTQVAVRLSQTIPAEVMMTGPCSLFLTSSVSIMGRLVTTECSRRGTLALTL